MLIGFFSKTTARRLLSFLPLLALVLWINGFVIKQDIEIQHCMPLYEMFKPLFGFSLISTFIALLFIVAEAFLLNFIIDKNEVLSKPSFLPALLYIIFMSIDNSMLVLHPSVLANLFVLLAIYVLTDSYRKNSAFSNAFDAGALFSIATLFYAPVFIVLPLLGIGLFIFRPFNWREWIICAIGLLMPFLFVLAFYFWNERLDYFWSDKIVYSIVKPSINYSSVFYVLVGIILIIIFLSLGNLFRNLTGVSQKKIKITQLLIWLSVFALLSLQRAPSVSCKYFSLFAIPVSVFCAEYLLSVKRKWWSELLFTILFVSLIINLTLIYF